MVHRGRRGPLVAAVKIAKKGGAKAVLAEAALLRALARRWGPRLIEVGADFLATSWTEGVSLEEASSKDRTRLAAVVAHGVGRGLDELHAMRVRHGDVKRSNVIVSPHVPSIDRAEDRGATLIDIGLAVRGEGFAGGTPRYLAPEVRRGEAATPAADLFALGIVLAEILEPSLVTASDPATTWLARKTPDDEIAKVAQKIVAEVGKATGATLRA